MIILKDIFIKPTQTAALSGLAGLSPSAGAIIKLDGTGHGSNLNVQNWTGTSSRPITVIGNGATSTAQIKFTNCQYIRVLDLHHLNGSGNGVVCESVRNGLFAECSSTGANNNAWRIVGSNTNPNANISFIDCLAEDYRTDGWTVHRSTTTLYPNGAGFYFIRCNCVLPIGSGADSLFDFTCGDRFYMFQCTGVNGKTNIGHGVRDVLVHSYSMTDTAAGGFESMIIKNADVGPDNLGITLANITGDGVISLQDQDSPNGAEAVNTTTGGYYAHEIRKFGAMLTINDNFPVAATQTTLGTDPKTTFLKTEW